MYSSDHPSVTLSQHSSQLSTHCTDEPLLRLAFPLGNVFLRLHPSELIRIVSTIFSLAVNSTSLPAKFILQNLHLPRVVLVYHDLNGVAPASLQGEINSELQALSEITLISVGSDNAGIDLRDLFARSLVEVADTAQSNDGSFFLGAWSGEEHDDHLNSCGGVGCSVTAHLVDLLEGVGFGDGGAAGEPHVVIVDRGVGGDLVDHGIVFGLGVAEHDWEGGGEETDVIEAT
jgi:hypothetical protein